MSESEGANSSLLFVEFYTYAIMEQTKFKGDVFKC